jgi:hypothetical protein
LNHCSNLNLSGAVFAVANSAYTTTDTATSTFNYSDLSGLNNLNLSGLKLGNSNDGENTIESNCFSNVNLGSPFHITDNPPY